MFVTVNVSFNAYACHEVHFVAKFMQSRTYVPKSSRHKVTFHLMNQLGGDLEQIFNEKGTVMDMNFTSGTS